jgi:hypothetical protein
MPHAKGRVAMAWSAVVIENSTLLVRRIKHDSTKHIADSLDRVGNRSLDGTSSNPGSDLAQVLAGKRVLRNESPFIVDDILLVAIEPEQSDINRSCNALAFPNGSAHASNHLRKTGLLGLATPMMQDLQELR